MGKIIIAQRRGKGSSTYKVSKKNFKMKLSFKEGKGVVKDIVNDTGRTAPVTMADYEDGTVGYIPAKEGVGVNDRVEDFVKPLSEIPESKPIFAIESYPNSGPTFCKYYLR